MACLLPQRDQLRTQSPPHLWEFKTPSDALTSTEAPWSLNSGIANSRKLYTSTNALFWHSKSCVLIHMFLYQKKKMQYSSCQWKVPNEKHLEPQTMFSCGRFLLPAGSRKATLHRAGKPNDQKQFLAISKWQEHLNKKFKRSLEIPIYLSIYL